MIKALWALARNRDVSLAECHQHWFEVHGQLHVSSQHRLLGYAQHHTLCQAWERAPQPTHDGASIVWLRDVQNYHDCIVSPAWQAASRDGRSGVRGGPLFEYPMAFSIASEHVVVEGSTSPFMVKAIHLIRRGPGLDREIFFRHWLEVSAPLCVRLPGLRRYVQNHGIQEGEGISPGCHDGWSELWFDDLGALHAALDSPEWAVVEDDARFGFQSGPVFDARETCLIIGRERYLLHPYAKDQKPC